MTEFLLDTNIVSALMRRPGGPIRRKIADVGFEAVYTSIIVVAEIRFGIARIGSARLAARLEQILGPLRVSAFEPSADEVYGGMRADLERRGISIGANDLWIAAQALHDGSVMVTDNEREFGRVPGLTVENWLRI